MSEFPWYFASHFSGVSAIRPYPGSATYVAWEPASRLVFDGKTYRAFDDNGVEHPECLQFIPAGWHPPLALPEEPIEGLIERATDPGTYGSRPVERQPIHLDPGLWWREKKEP